MWLDNSDNTGTTNLQSNTYVVLVSNIWPLASGISGIGLLSRSRLTSSKFAVRGYLIDLLLNAHPNLRTAEEL